MKYNYHKKVLVKLKTLNTIVFIVLFFFISIPSKSQSIEPIYRQFNADNGLPSSVIYHVFQDSQGYIWFATTNGVSRFDGYKFENFDIQNGLVDNEVFEIFEDNKHRIWFVPISCKLSYYQNGQIVSYKYNQKIKDNLPLNRGPIKCSFFVDSLDYVYISIKGLGRYTISPEGIFKEIEVRGNDINLIADQLPEGKILLTTPKYASPYRVIFNGLRESFEFSLNKVLNITVSYHHHLFVCEAPDSSIIMSLYCNIIQIKKGKVIKLLDLKKDIIWMSLDQNKLWVTTLGGGILCFDNFDFTSKPILNLLNDSQITSILKDKEGAYWFSTLNDGVFYCSDINLMTYTTKNGLADNRINEVKADNQGLYVGYEFGFVDLIGKNGIIRFKSPNPFVLNSSVRKIVPDRYLNRIWICSIENLYWIENNQVSKLGRSPSKVQIYPKSIIRSNDGGYWIAATRGLVRIENDSIKYESYASNEFSGTIYDLIEDRFGALWLCTLNGVWKYSNGIFQYLGTEDIKFAQMSNCIIENPKDSSIWIGTNGNGIIMVNDGKILQITQIDGLISNSVYKLSCNDDNIWAATRQGLSCITLINKNISIKNYTNANGLPTNEVSSVFEKDSMVYVGTAKGLTVFNWTKTFQDTSIHKVLITGLLVNNSIYNISDKNIKLDYSQNNLNFNYVAFLYRNFGRIQYRFRMIGVDTTWVYTQTPNCSFNGLAHGDYIFEVEAQNSNRIWSNKPTRLSFTIAPPFWNRTWFIIIASIAFSSLLFAVYRWRITSIRKKNELINNINQYKQQSLRQQMNPHFIFNTLNSIQLYILERDPVSSHKYLTKFARLMRMTLDNSLSSTVPLSDELEALKLYLDLEKLRLEEKFTYDVDYGSNKAILQYKIPTLLIQPFVENAIWHGIMLKEEQSGWVRIKLEEDGNIIRCIITDNGIGREQANRIRANKNKEHKSRGSQITQQRIDLLSSMYKEKLNIQYEDLYDINGIPIGTKVYISIPKIISTNS